jgi:hypothetical protein
LFVSPATPERERHKPGSWDVPTQWISERTKSQNERPPCSSSPQQTCLLPICVQLLILHQKKKLGGNTKRKVVRTVNGDYDRYIDQNMKKEKKKPTAPQVVCAKS